MGTSLTGLTPATTYDALIKVGDNGPLSATAKVLSDGLGNDSPLAMSTTLVGISTNTPTYPLGIVGDTGLEGNENYLYFHSSASVGSNARARIRAVGAGGGSGYGGDLRIDTRAQNNAWNTDVFTVANSGNVGIGTTSPNFILETAGTTGIGVRSAGVDGVYTDILSSVYSGNNNEQNAIQASVSGVASDSGFRFQVSDGSGLTTQTVGYQMNKDRHIFYANGSERVRVTTNGLTFNGDTAAANALDDYEEGTWTPGVAFGGGSTGITYSLNTGTYTKIGRQVTVNGYIVLTSKGSSTGSAQITGLPFTIPSNNANYSAPSFRFSNITFSGQFVGYGDINTTNIDLNQVTLLGALTAISDTNFANNSNMIVTLTYFV